MRDTNLARFRAAVAGALAHLESRRREVNDLNVFPVADGDTGDNMTLTLHAVLAELNRLQSSNEHRTIDQIGREEIVQSVARAALLGARGNSGVILSQLIRGAAEELVSRPGELIDATLVGAALANAADRAYSSVREPAEGTILTVAREMAHRIVTDVAHSSENPRLGQATPAAVQDAAIAAVLERAVEAGQESVRRGPELLAALREAGVVDAGGYGLTLIVAGVVAALRGEDPPALEHHRPARISHPQHSSSTYRFCVNFAVTGSGLAPGRYLAELEQLGDSVLVVGDPSTLKVHLHTDHPERATAVFAQVGEVSRLDVADMHAQVAERDVRLAGIASAGAEANGSALHGGSAEGAEANGARAEANGARENGASAPRSAAAAATAHAAARSGHVAAPSGQVGEIVAPPRRNGASAELRCGAVAVVNGAGLRDLFNELGAHTVDGGPTMNPSTYDLLAAVHAVPAEEVVLLPNSANVALAAEHAARLSDKQVLVARTTSQQAGLCAALAISLERSVEENARAVAEALASVRTGAVAPAARDDARGRFRRGEAVGFVEDRVVAWGEVQQTLQGVLAELARGGDGEEPPELISVLAGEDAPLALGELEAMVNGGIELELRHGGQSAYWWLVAAE